MKYNLTKEELKNPNLVLENIVATMEHEQAKDMLQLWYKSTETQDFIAELKPTGKNQFITFYECISKIIDGIFYKYEDFSVGKIREQELSNHE